MDAVRSPNVNALHTHNALFLCDPFSYYPGAYAYTGCSRVISTKLNGVFDITKLVRCSYKHASAKTFLTS